MSNKMLLRVVVYRNDDQWIAQGLQLDICAFGESAEVAMRRFDDVCQLESSTRLKRFGDTRAKLERAPSRFFDLWGRAAFKLTPKKQPPKRKKIICEVEARLAA